jgi:hypothetical protein
MEGLAKNGEKKMVKTVNTTKNKYPIILMMALVGIPVAASLCFYYFGGIKFPQKTEDRIPPATALVEKENPVPTPAAVETFSYKVQTLSGELFKLSERIDKKNGGVASVSGEGGYSASLTLNKEEVCNKCTPPASAPATQPKKVETPPPAPKPVAKKSPAPAAPAKKVVSKCPAGAEWTEWQTILSDGRRVPAKACVYTHYINGVTLGKCNHLPSGRAYPALNQKVLVEDKWVPYTKYKLGVTFSG